VHSVRIAPSFPAWQKAARDLLRSEVPPDRVEWIEDTQNVPGAPDLFSPAQASAPPAIMVPRRFVETAQVVARHPSAERWALLYLILWRVVRESRQLLDHPADPDVMRLFALEREVRSGGVAEVRQSASSARPFVPEGADLGGLARAASTCTGCDLFRNATQVVFGLGPANARIVLVGEQPGDQEDLRGKPFVGPAGEVLDRALVEAGIDRTTVYVTNVVKHFKWEPRGKRRLHQTPNAAEVQACRPWLEAELAVIKPEVVVSLGSTASQALLGPQFRVLKGRGQVLKTNWAPAVVATIHPSAVLRASDPKGEAEYFKMLVDDLKLGAREIGKWVKG
jgi:DNA polymerase